MVGWIHQQFGREIYDDTLLENKKKKKKNEDKKIRKKSYGRGWIDQQFGHDLYKKIEKNKFQKKLRKKFWWEVRYIDSLAVTFMTIDLSAHIPQPSRCPTAQSNVEN